MGTRLELWQSPGLRKERSIQQPFRRFGSILLVATLASSGVVAVAAPANAAVETVEYVSNADGVTTRSVRANVLDGSFPRDERLRPGRYVCDSKVERSSLTVVDDVELILGDNCELTITNNSGEIGGGAGILVPEHSVLTIWSTRGNTGRLIATGAPFSAGIGGSGASSVRGRPNSVSGDIRITGGTVIANGGVGAAGIGGSVYQTNGKVELVWRANVLARGGNASDSMTYGSGTVAEASSGAMQGMGAGPGIGVGGGSYRYGLPVSGNGRGVYVDTHGIVQAFGGRGTQKFGSGADIGRGGGIELTMGASVQPTVAISNVAVAQGGTVRMRDVYQSLLPAAPIGNLVPGSSVTFEAVPETGMVLTEAIWQESAMPQIAVNLIRFKIPQQSTNSRVRFSFEPSVKLTAAQQEVVQRIAELPESITSPSDADQVASVTNLWLALPEADRETLPALSNNRLLGAQHQAAAVNHAAIDAGVLVESAALDWNVRLIATSVHYDSAEFESARAALIDDRLLIALADIRYIDTLTGTEVMPSDDTIGTITFSGLNLAAYEHITAVVEQNGAAARETATTLRDENLQLAGIAAGRYLLTGNNVSDGGAGRGSAEDPREALMIALMSLIGVGALAVGGVVTQLSMRRNLRMVGK